MSDFEHKDCKISFTDDGYYVKIEYEDGKMTAIPIMNATFKFSRDISRGEVVAARLSYVWDNRNGQQYDTKRYPSVEKTYSIEGGKTGNEDV